ncbi:MAG: reverse transcriptase/maturase family protein [Candidatus Uhrbacteria bacterium]
MHSDEMGGLFDQLCSTEHLFTAWELFRRGKRSKSDVLVFERDLERNLFTLQEDLRSGAYRHRPYHAFTVHDPKARSIHKATVRDRVVHQAVVSVIEPIFERRFIDDSYSCRLGRGTHAAVVRLRTFLGRASAGDRRTISVLQCDIQQFFASVDHRVLLGLLCQRVRDVRMRALLERVVWSFSTVPGKGIPLGNLTSQLFANVYLHELDRFVKHGLRERWYLRYCDDFAIVHPDRTHLLASVPAIESFLRDALRLRLHPRKVTVRTWTMGVDFLGYVLLPQATVVRTTTKHRMLRALSPGNATSYFGICAHATTYRLQQVMRTKIGW